MNQVIIRTYSELILLPTFEERFEYLKLDGSIGEDTFGFDRYLNQLFYRSPEWRQVRNLVITRDLGCDLAIPEYLICTTKRTHNAIHYSDDRILIPNGPVIRTKNDQCPWKH